MTAKATATPTRTLGSLIYNSGGRRFLMCLGTACSSTVLLWFARMSDLVYRDIVLGVVAVYVAGNTWQKVKGGSNGAGS